MQISALELDYKKEIDVLKQKMQIYQSQQLESLQNLHQNKVEVIESDVEKLRKIIELKNQEIEFLIDQNKNLKQTYEDDKQLLRQEIEDLKHALAEQDVLFEQQFQEV